jgi:ribosomal protein L14
LEFAALVNNKIGKNRPARFYGCVARETREKHEKEIKEQAKFPPGGKIEKQPTNDTN